MSQRHGRSPGAACAARGHTSPGRSGGYATRATNAARGGQGCRPDGRTSGVRSESRIADTSVERLALRAEAAASATRGRAQECEAASGRARALVERPCGLSPHGDDATVS